MPTIRIDDDVFTTLQQRARPFVDTPNDVLRRVLGIENVPERHPVAHTVRRPSRRGQLDRTPEADFRGPILATLMDSRGRAAVSDVLKRVETLMKDRLRPDDFGDLKTGEMRWKNSAKWARKHMVEEGLLRANSPHGVWELSEQGREFMSMKGR